MKSLIEALTGQVGRRDAGRDGPGEISRTKRNCPHGHVGRLVRIGAKFGWTCIPPDALGRAKYGVDLVDLCWVYLRSNDWDNAHDTLALMSRYFSGKEKKEIEILQSLLSYEADAHRDRKGIRPGAVMNVAKKVFKMLKLSTDYGQGGVPMPAKIRRSS